MPLSPPVDREHRHTRRFEFNGYHRADGRWDIEGHLTDIKTYPVTNVWRGEIPPGEAIHDMFVRLTIDDDFVVRDIEMTTDAGPYRICPDITPNFSALKGVRIQPGWHQRLKEMFGGVKGCVHQAEMLGAMGTVAYQTLFSSRRKREAGSGAKPGIIESCHALKSDGEVVKRFWPAFYTGV